MTPNLACVENEYKKNKNLSKTQVRGLMEWVETQLHLPKINELQSILFLQSCCNDEEAAKKTVEEFFTIKTTVPQLFKQRNPLKSPIKESLDVTIFTPLPKKTPEGYNVMFLKLLDTNPRNLDLVTQLKIFDMICMMHLHLDGTSEGHISVIDMNGAVFRHLFCVKPFALKHFLHYVQEGVPGRVIGIHFLNVVPFIDTLLGIVRPLIKKELMDILYFHDNIDGLVKFVPLECLPEEYGGTAESVPVLHEKIKQRVFENVEFFEWEDQQNIDESKKEVKTKGWFRM